MVFKQTNRQYGSVKNVGPENVAIPQNFPPINGQGYIRSEAKFQKSFKNKLFHKILQEKLAFM